MTAKTRKNLKGNHDSSAPAFLCMEQFEWSESEVADKPTNLELVGQFYGVVHGSVVGGCRDVLYVPVELVIFLELNRLNPTIH